jgi:16S rRNA (guanine527-N7)-methyltransferase
MLFLKILPPLVRTVIDLGTGAGFPGLPMKIVREDLRLVLIEARLRRASFLSTVVRELGLRDVRVLAERAEHLVGELGDGFDAVVMRCAGPAEDLFPLAFRLVHPGGVVVAGAKPGPRKPSGTEVVTVHGPEGSRTFLVGCRQS